MARKPVDAKQSVTNMVYDPKGTKIEQTKKATPTSRATVKGQNRKKT